MNLLKLEIESEGEHNGYFTLHFDDGSVQGGWSCDQGSIEWDDDNFEPTDDDYNLCFDMWFKMDIDDSFEGRHFSTWENGKLSPTTKE